MRMETRGRIALTRGVMVGAGDVYRFGEQDLPDASQLSVMLATFVLTLAGEVGDIVGLGCYRFSGNCSRTGANGIVGLLNKNGAAIGRGRCAHGGGDGPDC